MFNPVEIDEDYIVWCVAHDDYYGYDNETAATVWGLLRKLKAEAWNEGFADGWDRGHYESGNETNPDLDVKDN